MSKNFGIWNFSEIMIVSGLGCYNKNYFVKNNDKLVVFLILNIKDWIKMCDLIYFWKHSLSSNQKMIQYVFIYIVVFMVLQNPPPSLLSHKVDLGIWQLIHTWCIHIVSSFFLCFVLQLLCFFLIFAFVFCKTIKKFFNK